MTFLFLFTLGAAFAQEEAGPMEDYVNCNRDAEVRPTNVRYQNAKRCQATAVIQGISYKCGQQSEAGELKAQFLKDLNANAKKRCESFCKEVGDGCNSHYSPFEKCVTVEGDLVRLGKSVGCHPTACGGQAFIYCSIYKGSFFRIEDSMFRNASTNCTCRRGK
jgi:hypothetical protein